MENIYLSEFKREIQRKIKTDNEMGPKRTKICGFDKWVQIF